MNIPNLITIARIFLVPLTVWLIISDAYGWAFVSFMVAGISDGIDGFLARRFNWRTELGAYLDPAGRQGADGLGLCDARHAQGAAGLAGHHRGVARCADRRAPSCCRGWCTSRSAWRR